MYEALAQLKSNHLSGKTAGMFAVCSSHPLVLLTAMEIALQEDRALLVEATANQVNQFGGYTGMTPADFATFVQRMATGVGLPGERVLIGADHLGPHVWKREPAAVAMDKAEVLIRACVAAGFRKIHLDTGMGCADDPACTLPAELAAQRAARLCHAAEQMEMAKGQPLRPLYVIGNEVPLPGGGLEEGQIAAVTDPDHLDASLAHYAQAFERLNLTPAWQRVVAVVTQIGVDFGDRSIAAYRPEPARPISVAHARLPGSMTFEIHATDYQSPTALKQMVQDHFILLKVGPCLTFTLRRTLYALAEIEAALPEIDTPSNLAQVMERLMTGRPAHWQSHYQGTAEELKELRHHSLRDRIRYYWSFPEARNAVERLMSNLNRAIPDDLLQAHLPDLYADITRDGLGADPAAIIQRAIGNALMPYVKACR